MHDGSAILGRPAHPAQLALTSPVLEISDINGINDKVSGIFFYYYYSSSYYYYHIINMDELYSSSSSKGVQE